MLACVEADGIGWNDVGNWGAFIDNPDAQGNSIIQGKERISLTNTKDCIILASEGEHIEVGNANDLIVVSFPDASLVMSKAKSQKIKDIFDVLEKNPDPRLRLYVEQAGLEGDFPHTILIESQDSQVYSDYGVLTDR